MVRCLIAFLLLLGLVPNSFSQDDPLFSGPQKGEPIPGFKMKLGLGDASGEEFDLVEKAGDEPLVIIFIHKRSRPSFAVANAIMKYAKQKGGEKLICGTCMLTADPTDTQKWLERVGRHFPKGIPIGYSMDGMEGPGSMGLNRNVEMTVIVAKDHKVVANFALVQPGAHADGPKILKSIAGVTGNTDKVDINDYLPNNQGAQDAPIAIDPNLRKQIRVLAQSESSNEAIGEAIQAIEKLIANKKPLQNQLGSIVNPWIRSGKIKSIGSDDHQSTIQKWAKQYGRRRGRGQMQRDGMKGKDSDQKRTNRFPQLPNLLRAVIQKSASDEDVDRAAKIVDSFVEKNPNSKSEIFRICNVVVKSGNLENYGTPHAQEILKAWVAIYSPNNDN